MDRVKLQRAAISRRYLRNEPNSLSSHAAFLRSAKKKISAREPVSVNGSGEKKFRLIASIFLQKTNGDALH